MTDIGWCPARRLDELQGFIDEEWSRGHVLATDAELLRWQHPRPDPDELSVLIADGDDGAIAGILGIIPAPFCERGERREGAWLTTWVVRPAERSRLLGVALLRHAIDHTDGLVATTGGNRTTMRILRTQRFHLVDAIPRWVRPVSAPALERLMLAAGSTALAFAPARGPAPAVPLVSDVRVAALGDEVAAAWDEAWRRLAPGLVGTWRDAAYLRWRYLQHPSFDYTVSVALDPGGEALALLVARRQPVRDRDEEVVRIVELLGDPGAQRTLVADMLATVDPDQTAFVDFYCTSAPFAAALQEAGFHRENPEAPFPSLFQPLDARRASLTGAFAASGRDASLFTGDDVYFTRSDGDQDRPN